MRKLILSLALWGAVLPVCAQSASTTPASGWASVQALNPNTTLHIKARTYDATCKLKSSGADSLTCLSSGNEQTFQRTDIKSIKISRRAQSTLVGLGIGAGVGPIIGASTGGNGGFIPRGALAAIAAVPLGVIGAIVGSLTDFTHSTIYKAP